MEFKQITIIGTGLIGGSFGLAVAASGIGSRVIGCDRPGVLERALKLGAIGQGIEDPVQAVKGSDLVFLATPVGAIIDLIERIGPVAAPDALITDSGSTKKEIVERARNVFGDRAAERFLGGHPMAGKEHGGIDHAEASLFRDAAWLLVPIQPEQKLDQGRLGAYRALLEKIGAKIIKMEAERQDYLCAWISHLPQMMSTALAGALAEEFGDDPDLPLIGGRALSEMTRIASSPYSMWRDIAHTNTGNIEQALSVLEQRLAHIRENLRSQALRDEFDLANRFELKNKT
ncbi:MAG TPA: prephenate dehydrogenase [Candidatus Angelobacter sp.]|jgi:prephenate dehydrogenase|nr:prephenate dehydrogenase [Candidatus Angelobacter sp.]